MKLVPSSSNILKYDNFKLQNRMAGWLLGEQAQQRVLSIPASLLVDLVCLASYVQNGNTTVRLICPM